MLHASTGILGLLLLALAPAAAAQEDVRELKSKGIKMSLPEGWSWTKDIRSDLSIQRQISDEGSSQWLQVQVAFRSRSLVSSILAGQWQLAEGQQVDPNGTIDRSTVKVETKLQFGKRRDVVRMSYDWIRNQDSSRSRINRWLLDRDGDCLEWTEICLTSAAGAAEEKFAEARKGLEIGKTTSPARRYPQRQFVNQKLRYKLPKGWIFTGGPRKKKVKLNDEKQFVTLFSAIGGAIEDGRGLNVEVSVQCVKSTQTPEAWLQNGRDGLLKNWLEVKDVEIDDRQSIAGRKASSVGFTGAVRTTKGPGPRRRVRYLVFSNKGRLVIWQESHPISDSRALKKLVRAGRKGLRGG